MANIFPLLLVAGGAALLMGKKKRRASASSGEGSPRSLLKELATRTGNADVDPDNLPMDAIITEIQLTFGIEPADGKWSPEVESAVRQFLAEN